MTPKQKTTIERAPAAVVDESIFEGDYSGLENIRWRHCAFWLDDEVTIHWAAAIEAIDKTGDKKPLRSLLQSKFEMTSGARQGEFPVPIKGMFASLRK
jgi:hypothetical protein